MRREPDPWNLSKGPADGEVIEVTTVGDGAGLRGMFWPSRADLLDTLDTVTSGHLLVVGYVDAGGDFQPLGHTDLVAVHARNAALLAALKKVIEVWGPWHEGDGTTRPIHDMALAAINAAEGHQ